MMGTIARDDDESSGVSPRGALAKTLEEKEART